MKIILNNSITKVIVYKKCVDQYSNLSIENNFKRKIGRKWFIFPVYETIPSAVVKYGWSNKEFICSVENFKNTKRYIENGEIYFFPHCTFHMNDGSKEDMYFQTEENLLSYVKQFQKENKHIIIK
jgi:hypothetical protein